MSKKIFEHQVNLHDALGWKLHGQTLREALCAKAWDQFRFTIDLFTWIWLYNNDDMQAEVVFNLPMIRVEIWQREKVHAEQL